MSVTERVAGRELDKEIAERVFGEEVTATHYTEGGTGIRTVVYSHGPIRLPHYSTDIAAAWRVFVWLVERTGRCVIIADMEEFDADNAVIVRVGLSEDMDIEEYWYPAPLALCRAALSWLDEKERAA